MCYLQILNRDTIGRTVGVGAFTPLVNVSRVPEKRFGTEETGAAGRSNYAKIVQPMSLFLQRQGRQRRDMCFRRFTLDGGTTQFWPTIAW